MIPVNDYASDLAARKAARGNQVDPETIRQQVENFVGLNIKGGRAEDVEEERQRLIKLRYDEDAREDLEYRYAQQGIKVYGDHTQIGKISSVRLKFNNKEWADLLNAEGDCLPSCCANISRVRDIFESALRNDKYCDVDQMFEAVMLLKGHHEITEGPLFRFIKLWERIEPDARTERGEMTLDLNDPRDACRALSHASNVDFYYLMFHDDEDPDRHTHCKANKEQSLSLLLAAVRTLYHRLGELSEAPVEGYGIFQGSEIASSNTGIAIYDTKDFAEKIAARWNKEDHEKYEVKKARVTLEKGVEIVP